MFGSGKVISEQVWKDIIQEADKDSDGTIDFEEFKKLMFKMLSKSS